jgi:dipeptidyl aminopeptidase/acylaminoacyl peptidase
MTARCRLAAAVLAATLGFGAPILAQPRAMGFVDLINIPRISDPRVSPDGETIAYVLSVADWKADKRLTHIWRVPAAGGDPVQLTYGADSEREPHWSPDGRSIAFVTKRNGEEAEQIFLLPVAGGEARPLTNHTTKVSDIEWSPDGSSIYFIAPDPKTDAQKAREKVKDDVYAFDENYEQTHLWKVAVGSGAETRLTQGDFSVVGYRLSQDGRKIVQQRAPDPLLGERDQVELWVADADGSHAAQITRNSIEESDPVLSPDNSQVLFVAGANERLETYYNGRLFAVPAAGGPARVLAGGAAPAWDVSRAEWSRDGRTIYFTANVGVREELFEMPASGGAPKALTDGPHAAGNWSLEHGRLAFTLQDATSPGDIWTVAGAAAPVRTTHVFDFIARDFKLGRQELVQWKGADGATVEGLLTYPIDYQAGQKYPLAVFTHGGPQASDKYSIGSSGYEIQVYAGKGYAVLQPNYRGSTGYGDAFERDMVGHYFKNAHLDVMGGVDEVIRRGIADPDRLVKFGWSGGGHMTNKLITFTDRFKAAASGAGAANWISMYAQSDIRSYRTPWFGGTPWQKDAPIDAYWNNSPLKDVSNVKTPTIFFVGEKDPRVPMPQSVEMHRALKSNGVPTHLYVAPREPHGWAELRHQLFKCNVEMEWFEKYATKRPYTWEKAPGDDTPARTSSQAAQRVQ